MSGSVLPPPPTRSEADSPVQCHVDGDILVAVIDNPPVNALGQRVRAALLAAVERLERDATLRAMLLCARGPVFIGGADIREFSGPRLEPLLSTVCDRLEACRKPIVAVIHGAALGGGFEVALAAHYRVASSGAEFAFPEIALGLLPGAGGTQRAPRLCGAACALDLMLGATRISAAHALQAGLVDRVVYEPFDEALQWARELAQLGHPVPRARDGRALADAAAERAVVERRRASLDRARAPFAAWRILDCVQQAIEALPAAGMAFERAAFLECLASPQRAALVHVFFAERAAHKRRVDVAALGRKLVEARDGMADDPASPLAMEAMRRAAQALVDAGEAESGDCDVASIRYAGVPRETGGVLWQALQQAPSHDR